MICAFLKSSSNTWLCIYCWIKTNKMELRGEIPTVSLKHSLDFSFNVWCWNSVEYEWHNNFVKNILKIVVKKKSLGHYNFSIRKDGLHSNLNILWSVMAFGVLFNELFYCQIWKLVGNGHNQVDCVKLDEYCKYN